MPRASTATDLCRKTGRYHLETWDFMVPQMLFTATEAIGFDTALPANRFSNVRACCPSVELGKLSGREQNTR